MKSLEKLNYEIVWKGSTQSFYSNWFSYMLFVIAGQDRLNVNAHRVLESWEEAVGFLLLQYSGFSCM